MKNLLTYISPKKKFNQEHKKLVKIQIDNSLALGWQPADILLATNFDYEYKGIRSLVLNDDLYYSHRWTATKIFVIDELLRKGLIKELTWYHDFDCFQLAWFDEIEAEMEGVDFGLTQYGRMPRLCSASMFFKPTAKSFVKAVIRDIKRFYYNEEYAIMRICGYNEAIKAYPTKYKVRKLDITYALHRHNFNHVYARAKKPIKATHFHITPDKYDFFIRGNNKINLKLIPDYLVSIFHQHGFNG